MKRTCEVVEVRLLQESRVSERPSSTHPIFSQLISCVGSTPTVADAGKLGTVLAVLLLDLRNPSRNVFIGDGQMLVFPRLEVETWIGSSVVFALSMLPYCVLRKVTLANCSQSVK